MKRKNPLCEEVEERLGLFVSDDLSREESDVVSRHLKYCPSCAGEYDAWTKIYETLQDSAIGELPVDNISVWDCIEPKLGPASRTAVKPRWTSRWISTPQLSAAFVLMVMVTLFAETRRPQESFTNGRDSLVLSDVPSVAGNTSSRPISRPIPFVSSSNAMWPPSIGGQPVYVATANSTLDPQVPFAELGLILGRTAEAIALKNGEVLLPSSGRRPVVDRVVRDSIAYKAGFKRGDIIVSVGNEEVENIGRFVDSFDAISVLNRIEVEIIRMGERKSITFALNSDESGKSWIRVPIQRMPCRDCYTPPTSRSFLDAESRRGTFGTDDSQSP